MLRTKTLSILLGFLALAFIAAAEFTSRSCYDADSMSIDAGCQGAVEVLLTIQIYLLLAMAVLLLAMAVRGVPWILQRVKASRP
jgi:hypothetical protein